MILLATGGIIGIISFFFSWVRLHLSCPYSQRCFCLPQDHSLKLKLLILSVHVHDSLLRVYAVKLVKNLAFNLAFTNTISKEMSMHTNIPCDLHAACSNRNEQVQNPMFSLRQLASWCLLCF